LSAGQLLAALVLCAAAGACSKPPPEPLQLDGNMLTVYNSTPQDWIYNSTPQDWSSVEIYLNNYYRVVTPAIAAGGQFKAPLDVFVEAYGRRFDFKKAQIKTLQLKAKLPDGKDLVLDKAFQLSGLSGALGGKK
jgi:hypothetical protein